MRRSLACLAIAPVLVLTLAACGGGNDDNGTTASTTGGAHATVTVHAQDTLKFDKTAYTAKAGTIDIDYVNDGSQPHTLLIQGNKKFKLGIGREDKGTVTLAAGTYTLYCNLPGHEAAGMKATLTVSS
jgi:plastocyanin